MTVDRVLQAKKMRLWLTYDWTANIDNSQQGIIYITSTLFSWVRNI